MSNIPYIETEDDEQATPDNIDFVICLDRKVETGLLDNLFGPCSRCGIELQFRPDVFHKKHICFDCIASLKDVNIVLTPEQVELLALLNARVH